MKNISAIYLIIIGCFYFTSISYSQTAVAVGSGSYASSIPSDPAEFWAGDVVNIKQFHDTVTFYALDNLKAPFPTNKWWSGLLFKNNIMRSFNIWAHPLCLTVEKYGVGFHYATEWTGIAGAYKETMSMISPTPLQITGNGFAPVVQKVKSWGDWTMAFRVIQSETKYMDVTIGHGLPTCWVEYQGIDVPQINVKNATFFDDNGTTISFPFTGNHIGVYFDGRSYGLFAPDGTIFSNANGTISMAMTVTKKFIAVSALTAKNRLSFFAKYAYSVPRNSQMDWTYDTEGGKVSTNWTLTTECLQGTEHNVIQGWIPHHYRNSTNAFSFTGDEYVTARGKLKCAVGTSFQIGYQYNGALTNLPAPESNNFDRSRMLNYLNGFSQWQWDFNSETYAGGKQVAMFARQLCLAKNMNSPVASTLKAKVKIELQNFLTYTPGESSKYFCYSDKFGGLIGITCGFGSHRFNDHHFHYGYYVYSAGILSQYDQDFATKYGEMAKIVAKDYANWDRTDSRFPVLRMFDIWEGHSNACGYDVDSNSGQNQESSSEAMMSWSGVITLGNSLNDNNMTATGVMGYCMESAAVNEYWFNRNNDNYPAAYTNKISCITWGSMIQYITYFGPEPIFVHGIQYLPVLPSSYYLVKDSAAARKECDFLISNSANNSVYTNFKTRDSWGTEWACEVMKYRSMFDPDWSINWYEDLWKKQDGKATDNWFSSLAYYQMYSNKDMGSIDWTSHIATPNSGVFYNPTTNQYTYSAFNTKNTVQEFNVYKANSVIGKLRVPANSFYSSHTLDGNTPPAVQITSPIDQSMITDRNAVVTVTATASDLEGAVSNVEFYCNGLLLKSFTQPPYTCTMTNFSDDTTYSLYAKAYDNNGATAYSDNVAFNVNIPADTCSIDGVHSDFSAVVTTKKNPYIVFKPNVNCTWVNVACFKGKGGRINMGSWGMTKDESNYKTQVKNIAVGDSLRFWFTWGLAEGGQRDNSGTPDSMIVASCIGTLGNLKPTVSLTSPIDGTVFKINSVTLTVNANDTDGTISKVEFYNGSKLLGSTTQLPYSLLLNNLTDGANYSVYAKAYDNLNGSALSNTVTFSINIPGDTCEMNVVHTDFKAFLTTKTNPYIIFKPQASVNFQCPWVIVTCSKNGIGIGGWYMIKDGNNYKSQLTANAGDELKFFFTWGLTAGGQRDNSGNQITTKVAGCLTSAVEIPSIEDGFRIYPNPTKGDVVISAFGFNFYESILISITDLTGKSMFKETITSTNSGEINNALHLKSKLAPGLYFISAKGASTLNQVRTLIIQ
jgi:endoglucanase Acf2